MDLSKISKGGQVFAGASIVYFIAALLPWYTLDAPAQLKALGADDYSSSAFGDLGFLWGALWAIALLAGAILIILPAFGVTAPKLPAVAFLAVSALAAFFTILKLLIGEDDPIETGFGIILAAIAAVGAVFGAFLMFKESGGDLDDLKDMNKLKASFGGGSGGGTPPPPPPGMTPPPPPPGSTPPPPPPMG